MSLLSKILFIFILLSGIIHAQDCKPAVTISTNSDKAEIYIDNEFIGNGNAKINLSLGRHKILIKENKRNWNPELISEEINLTDCNDKVFNYTLNSELILRTNPQDVYVFENDSLLGHTPLKLSQSFGTLRLYKPGFDEKLITHDEIGIDETVDLNFTGERGEESFFKSNAFKILVGSIIVLGGTSAYFKLKADDIYDEYQITGDNALLNKTRDYDLISGITFGVLQVNFGIMIYYFLID